ncbi:MAG: hypothetical protein NOF05_12675 [Candidatus Accumulibacter phosphatis]|nr:hypothetical protein [Candidatus Accumulibacter phosphatis]
MSAEAWSSVRRRPLQDLHFLIERDHRVDVFRLVELVNSAQDAIVRRLEIARHLLRRLAGRSGGLVESRLELVGVSRGRRRTRVGDVRGLHHRRLELVDAGVDFDVDQGEHGYSGGMPKMAALALAAGLPLAVGLCTLPVHSIGDKSVDRRPFLTLR